MKTLVLPVVVQQRCGLSSRAHVRARGMLRFMSCLMGAGPEPECV